MKNQIKKSLSLIMAVLMVLSCWVWVAPQKAEAATSYYPIKVGFQIENSADGDDDLVEFKVFYKESNGKGTQEKQHPVFQFKSGDNGGFDQGEYFTVNLNGVPGFPTRVEFAVKDGSFWSGKIVVVWDALFIGNSGDLMTGANAKYTREASASGWSDAAAETVGSAECPSWTYPTITEISGDANNGINLPVNVYGGADSSSLNATEKRIAAFTSFKDQYGVDWVDSDISSAEMDFYISNTAKGKTESAVDENGTKHIWAVPVSNTKNQASVSAKASLQDIHPYKDDGSIGDLYLVAKMNKKTSLGVDKETFGAAKINLLYPKYDWKFYGNGNGTVSASPTTKIEMAGTTVDSGANPNTYDNDVITNGGYKYYGQTIKDYYPTGNATKEGYTFYGFWTVQQPSVPADKSNPYAFMEDFIQPIDKVTYDTLAEDEKDRYVSAGVKWDPKNADLIKTNLSEKNVYYAWWLSKDVSVKFYDINGKFLQEETLKYGYTNNALKWPTPQASYVSGSYTYSNFTGIWENIDGEEVNQNGYTFTHDLILTPKYKDVSFTDKYKVTVYNTYGANAWAAYTKDYNYRDTAVLPAGNLVTALPSNAVDYSYTFEGWSTSAPSADDSYSGNYHVMIEDGDFDETGKAVYLATDFTVRDNVTYYPVFRRHVKSYDVAFTFKDSTGADKTVSKNFKYGEVITAPDGVPKEYATQGYGYTFQGWTYNNADVILNTVTCKPDLLFIAKYSEGVPTPYTVTFEYYNDKGEVATATAQVNHGSCITQETVAALAPAAQYDDGKALYTYNGIWEYDGTRYSVGDLKLFSPENHVTFKAVYENPKNFYTVTYVDGSNTKSYRVLDGSKLPYWTYEVAEGEETKEETYLPSRADTVEGKYTFTGWFDAQEGGNQYVPSETPVTGNVTLYPQFSFGKFEYHIVFNNYNGTELAKGTFNYQDDITALINEAESKAVRAADKVYTYQFIGWDKKVPTFCEGGEPGSTLTFTAQYKPVYIFYDIEWYNSKDDMEGGKKALATTLYVYGDRVRTPSVTLTPPVSDDANTTYVFAGWKYLENGVEKDYNRNLEVNGDMKLYATYAEAPKSYKVTVIVDSLNPTSDKNYSFSVKSGEALTDYVSDPISGYIDVNIHNKFNGWVTKNTQGDVEVETDYDLATPVTDNVTIYALFIESPHVYNKSEVTKVPTYPVDEVRDDEGNVLVKGTDGKGELTKWCECDTKRVNTKKEEIAALIDTVAPTGTAYIGTQWKTGDGSNELVYANPKTDIILTSSDKGDKNDQFNPSELGIGVDKIEACIVEADTVLTDRNGGNWQTVYDWSETQLALIGYYGSWDKVPAMYHNYSGNATTKLGSQNLTDGKTYIAYAIITDKNGNEHFMRTAKFLYDATAPEMTLDGLANISNDIFCEEAIVTTDDENATVTANGGAATRDDDGKYHIDKVGAYKVVVADKSGNETTAYIQVVEHEYRKVTTPATCFQGGYVAQTCYNCGHETDIEYPEELEWTGHLALKTVVTEATCTKKGYEEITCSACGLNETNDVVQDETGDWVDKYPALGHDWSSWIVVNEATCIKAGLERRSCPRCDTTETQPIAINKEAHNFYPAVRLAPTCTQNGRRTQTCRLCGDVIVLAQADDENAANYNAAYKAKGHTADEADESNWVVTKAATCATAGSKKLVCEVCNADMGKTKEIPATGEHIWELDEANCKEPTATEEGVIAYRCKNCTNTKSETVAKINKYTVTFMSEDGKTEIAKIERIEGTSIGDGMPAEPTKDATDLYRYEFAGWFTADGKEYKASTPVISDLTLFAKFNQKNVYYTLQYKTYTDGTFEEKEIFMELMGAVGDTRLPSYNPSIPADKEFSYKFEGWYTSDNQPFDGKVTAAENNRTLTAKFTKIAQEYDVVFLDWDGTGLGKVTVKAGSDATWTGATPTRAADKDYHYTFEGWDGNLTKITSTTRVKAKYTATAHTWNEGTVTQKQDCFKAEETTYTCTEETCKYQKTEETKPALNHPAASWKTEFDKDSGMNITVCQLCNTVVKKEQASYTIVLLNYNGSRLDTITGVQVNAFFHDQATAVESKATHTPDEESFYYFNGWVLQGTEEPVYKSNELPAATADATYVATYRTSPRTYTVTFAKIDNTAVATFSGIKYKTTIAVVDGEEYDIKNYTFNAEEFGIPESDSENHYSFDKWSVDLSGGVTADVAIRPVYKETAHDFDKNNDGKLTDKDDAVPSQATCTQSGGYKYTCEDCGYSYVDGNIPALKHNYTTTVIKEPTFEEDGLNKLVCVRCGDVQTETVPAKTRITVEVTVKNSSNKAIEGAKVTITHKDSGKKYGPNLSNQNGIATFYVDEAGKYFVTILEIPGHDGGVSGEITVGEDGKITNNTVPTVKDESGHCSCTCHKGNFWGTLFRFFHKIIKFFAGKYICCSCPDSRY